MISLIVLFHGILVFETFLVNRIKGEVGNYTRVYVCICLCVFVRILWLTNCIRRFLSLRKFISANLFQQLGITQTSYPYHHHQLLVMRHHLCYQCGVITQQYRTEYYTRVISCKRRVYCHHFCLWAIICTVVTHRIYTHFFIDAQYRLCVYMCGRARKTKGPVHKHTTGHRL